MSGSRNLKKGDAAFKGFDAHSVPSGSVYKYIIGKHSTKEDAQANLSTVRKSFPDAFIVKVEGDKVTRP
jgi:N-acetylmuramoyl-L-alanine amidase